MKQRVDKRIKLEHNANDNDSANDNANTNDKRKRWLSWLPTNDGEDILSVYIYRQIYIYI